MKIHIYGLQKRTKHVYSKFQMKVRIVNKKIYPLACYLIVVVMEDDKFVNTDASLVLKSEGRAIHEIV